MSVLSNYLYELVVAVQINNPGTSTRNRIVYAKPIKIYKGVNNPITLKFYNEDQKLVSILDTTVDVNIINQADNAIYLTKRAIISAVDRGTATVTIMSNELLALPAGHYTFSVQTLNEFGESVVVYSDDNYGVGGSVQLVDGVYPTFLASDTLTINSNNATSDYSISNMRLSNAPLTHTAQFYFSSFTGNITIQGTLDELPDENLANWFDLQTIPYVDKATNDYATWTGIYSAVRFKVLGNVGTVSTILYRP